MKAVHFDAKTGNELQAHEASQRSNVTNFCSWRRLAGVFRDAGELFPDESIVSFQVDERGITYRVTTTTPLPAGMIRR